MEKVIADLRAGVGPMAVWVTHRESVPGLSLDWVVAQWVRLHRVNAKVSLIPSTWIERAAKGQE